MQKRFIYLLIGLALGACTATHDAHEGHEGHNHHDTFPITSYAGGYELYAEVTPMSVGNDCDITAHITRLSDFSPVGEGRMTVTLELAAGSATSTSEAPSRPGVYEFELEPATAGEGTLTFEYTAADGRRVLFSDPVTVYADEHEAHHEADEMAVHSANGVAFSKEMSWRSDFATAEVSDGNFGQVLHLSGTIEPSQNDIATLVSRSAGTVEFAGGMITPGQSVAAGQTLFYIDGSGLADNDLAVRVARARNEYETARAEYGRVEALAADRLVTAARLAEARLARDNAEAEYNALARSFRNGRSAVVSPMAGFVGEINVQPGTFVDAGTPLATVVRTQSLILTVQVPVADAARISGDVSGTVTPAGTSDVYTFSDLDARLLSRGQTVSGTNPLVPVTFSIRNNGEFIPGSFAAVNLRIPGAATSISVPVGAVVEEMGNHFVYVQLTPEYFEKRPVRIGASDGATVSILSGLTAGERIVTRGAVLVRLAQNAGALDAHSGHVH